MVSYRQIKNTFRGNSAIFINKLFFQHSIHIAQLLISLIYGFCTPLKIQSRLRLFGLDSVKQALEMRKGVIMVCGHTGDWESSANRLAAYLRQENIYCDYIRKNLRQPWLETMVFSRAQRHGISIILHNEYPLKRVLRSLKHNRLVFFVMDQNPKLQEAKTTVHFFGQNYSTYASLEKLAKRTGAPIILTYCYRRGFFRRHNLVFCPVLQTDTEGALTQNCMTVLENYILSHPSQWIWSYPWKNHEAP